VAGLGVVVVDVEGDGLGSPSAADEQYGQHGSISAAAGRVVVQAGGHQAADLAVFDVAASREASAGNAGKVDGPGQVLAVHQAEAPGLPEHTPEGGQVPVGGRWRAVLGQPGPERLSVGVAEAMPGDVAGQQPLLLSPSASLLGGRRTAVDESLG
jgi:hypothetical protein